LVRWFHGHKRALPWRTSRDPYRVWVAEVMLQQTRVETVARRYPSFLRRFPSVRDLAAADESDVLKEWEGLGYYSRARHLRLAAREIEERYGGRFPTHPDQLRRLPGIGRYTAAAVASIAFNRPVAAVDGNVVRVVARLYGIAEPITRAAVQRRIEELTQALIPPGRAADFTEALMELGALVCTPGRPDCPSCPWIDACVAHKEGSAAQLPNRPKRRPPRLVHGAVAVVTRGGAEGSAQQSASIQLSGPAAGAGGGRVLVVRRPPDGLLGGLWEFPWVEVAADASPSSSADAVVQALRGRHGVAVIVDGRLRDVSHVFSHLEWRLRVFTARATEDPVDRHLLQGDAAGDGEDPGLLWAAPEELRRLAFGRAHRRIADAWLARG